MFFGNETREKKKFFKVKNKERRKLIEVQKFAYNLIAFNHFLLPIRAAKKTQDTNYMIFNVYQTFYVTTLIISIRQMEQKMKRFSHHDRRSFYIVVEINRTWSVNTYSIVIKPF